MTEYLDGVNSSNLIHLKGARLAVLFCYDLGVKKLEEMAKITGYDLSRIRLAIRYLEKKELVERVSLSPEGRFLNNLPEGNPEGELHLSGSINNQESEMTGRVPDVLSPVSEAQNKKPQVRKKTLEEIKILPETPREFCLYFAQRFYDKYKAHYVISWGMEAGIFKTLLASVPPKSLKKAIDFLFQSDQSFIDTPTVKVLMSGWKAKIFAEAEKWIPGQQTKIKKRDYKGPLNVSEDKITTWG